MRDRIGWWMVCLMPRFVAQWLMWNRIGERVPLPASWIPYICGRSIGRDGRQSR